MRTYWHAQQLDESVEPSAQGEACAQTGSDVGIQKAACLLKLVAQYLA